MKPGFKDRCNGIGPVAPCAGAWIETSTVIATGAEKIRRPLRGGVD